MATTEDPPPYATVSDDVGPALECQASSEGTSAIPLPTRTSEDTRVLHPYYMTNTLGYRWATLKIWSRLSGQEGLPLYHDGDMLQGELELNIKHEERVKEISVMLCGKIDCRISSNVFLEMKRTLWSSSSDRCGTFSGQYVWPFSFVIPRKAFLQLDGDIRRSFLLPPTCYDNTKGWEVQYEVQLTFDRDRLLRPDDKLVAPVELMPLTGLQDRPALIQPTCPGDPPFLGYGLDPNGWSAPESTLVVGTTVTGRPIAVTCKLQVENPLCYVRGSVIRCILTVETDDPLVLDLLTSEHAPQVKLMRKLGFEKDQALHSGLDDRPRSIPEDQVNIVSVTKIESAAWWKPDDKPTHNQTRCTLNGEILVADDLTPSCFFPGFVVLYEVAMYPFLASEFSSAGGRDTPLIRQKVDIVPQHGPGPSGQMPPSYASLSGPQRDTRSKRSRVRLPGVLNAARPLLPGTSVIPPRRRLTYDIAGAVSP